MNRLLIVGSGAIGKRHFEVLKTLYPHSDIRFLSRATKDLQLSEGRYMYTWDEVDEFSPNLAIIANPAPFHFQVGVSLAKKGVHLLVEKPICNHSLDADLLVSECNANNVFLKVGYNLRYLSSLQTFRKLIINGVVGDLMSVRAEVGQYLPDWRKGVDYRDTVSACKNLGGGVLLELSHEIDYLNWIFGTPDSVIGVVSKQSKLEIDVEDNADLLIRYCIGSHEKSFLVANLSMDFIRFNPVRQCTVIGSTGSIRWDGIANTVEHYKPSKSAWATIFIGQDTVAETYFSQMRDFMSTVLSNNYDNKESIDSIQTLRCIEAAKKSSIIGAMCPINDYK